MNLANATPRGAQLPALLALALVSGCAVNPATGGRQLSLIGEGQEIQMGREADVDIVASLGVYDDPAMQSYVQELGERLAATSERPDLPWTFRVLDDPVINAFALPGGFIYVTRGILSHFGSEAELAGVLGHEIGHVTARHSVNQMSKAQLAQLGVGLGMVFVPELQQFEGLAGASLQLLFLKFGRDDERQADELGFRYMTRANYDPHALAGVFRMLRGSSGGEAGRIPEWLSTHPDPENREAWAVRAVAEAGRDFSAYVVREAEYVRRLDGMVFGQNPREGYFQDNVFFHPDLAFRIDFPAGWTTANQRNSVQAVSSEQDAAFLVTIEEATSPSAARQTFLSQQGIRRGDTSDRRVGGFPAAWAEFQAQTQDGSLTGLVAFVAYGGAVYRLLGFASSAAWSRRAAAVEATISSFQQVTDRTVLSVEPRKLEVVRVPSALSFEEFVGRYPSTVADETISLINHAFTEGRFPSGALAKRVVGGQLP